MMLARSRFVRGQASIPPCPRTGTRGEVSDDSSSLLCAPAFTSSATDVLAWWRVAPLRGNLGKK